MDDAPNGDKILSVQENKFYKQDLFGLETTDETGKIHFENTTGYHMQFIDDELVIGRMPIFLSCIFSNNNNNNEVGYSG